MTTIPEVLADRAARFSDEEAFVDGELRMTFAQLAAAAADVGSGLLARGVGPGDRVALWLPNCYEWVVSALALQLAGACLVPLNTRFKSAEVRHILNRTRAAVLIAPTTFLGVDYLQVLASGVEEGDVAGPLLPGLPHLRHAFAVDGGSHEFSEPWSSLAAGIDGRDGEIWDRAREVTDDDVCDILFTSGTTGLPKGAVCTHGDTVKAYEAFSHVVGLQRGDRYLIVNPFFHAFGYKAGWLSCLLVGATAYPVRTFDVDRVVEIIGRERITVFPGPPTVYHSIMDRDDIDTAQLTSLRLSVTGSTTVPTELVRRMQDRLTFEHILVGYGLTEAIGLGTMCRPGDDPETVAQTSGRPMLGMELRIVGDDGVDRPQGCEGEILLRGHLMRGYFEDENATREVLDDAGWLHTGDIGLLDGNGNLRVTDRKKDMYIVGGFNVYPAEVENLILGDDRIDQVAVVGVPDERLGEVGFAFVVIRSGAHAEPDEFVSAWRARMANFKAPRFVEICRALPLTANGKVMKDELRRRAADVVIRPSKKGL
jgi:acyl-CoA synthetase (AMP-forming)/AMP-acid ligase II